MKEYKKHCVNIINQKCQPRCYDYILFIVKLRELKGFNWMLIEEFEIIKWSSFDFHEYEDLLWL